MENNEWDHTIILNNRQVTTDIVVLHLHISYGSADEFIHKRHAFNKFVHNGFQNNSQKSTNTTDWPTATAFPTAIATKVWHSWDTQSLGTRCGFTTMSQTVNARVWEENIWHCQSQWRWKQSHQEETDADTFLRLTRTNSCSLSREGHKSKQSLLQWDVLGLVKMSYLNKMPTSCYKGQCTLAQ